MAIDLLSSTHWRPQASSSSSTFRKQVAGRESWSALFRRHRFLLTALAVLAFLCSIYLYFVVTLGAAEQCSGLHGAEKDSCMAKASALNKGKLKFF